MTPKQERFVQEYLVDLNATKAAERAGYSPKTCLQQGPRLLGNVGVAEAIKAGLAKRAKKLEINAQWVLDRLIENHQLALEQVRPDLSAANKSLELVGRHLAMFTDKQEVSADVTTRKAAAEVPEPASYAEWLQARLAGTFGSTSGNGNGNRLKKVLEP